MSKDGKTQVHKAKALAYLVTIRQEELASCFHEAIPQKQKAGDV
jgi:hypothetical protein